MSPRPRVAWRYITVPLLLVLVGLAAQAVMGEPSLTVSKPGDGDWFVEPDVAVSGHTVPDLRTLNIFSEGLQTGTFVSTSYENGKLVFRPIPQFDEQFHGENNFHDTWLSNGGGRIQLKDGVIDISGIGNYSFPFIVSRGDSFPIEADWVCRVSLRYNDDHAYSNYTKGYGWGMTANATNASGSLVAIYSDVSFNSPHPYNVLVNGSAVAVWDHSTPARFGTLTVRYFHGNDTYLVVYDGEVVATVIGLDRPVRFWMGCPEWETLDVMSRITMFIDYMDVWTHSGSWTSRVFDLGGPIEVGRRWRPFTTSHPFDDRVAFEVRTSTDNVTWSDWDGVRTDAGVLDGRYFQFRVLMSLEGVRFDDAYIEMTSLGIEYTHPVVTAQVRVERGSWQNATLDGGGSWRATVTLFEDLNLVEARVMDSAGHSNHTSMSVVLDTTVPTGTATMDVENVYTNDRNVSFWFNASDRYGIKAVRIALDDLYTNEEVFEPYVEAMVWTMPGGFVKTDVYIRFEDVHGLLSEPVHFVFFYDPLPPTGAVHIMGGADHTDLTTVYIDLDYQDNEALSSVELCRNDSFFDPIPVELGTHRVEGWDLEAGASGTHVVYMRVRDVAGNQVVVSDEIDLYVATARGGVDVVGGDATSERLIQVFVDPPDDVEILWMQISEDPAFTNVDWMDIGHYSTYMLAEGDMEHTVYVRFRDIRGYATIPVSTTVLLDTTPPALELTLDGGTYWSTDTDISVDLSYEDAMDPAEMWYLHRNAFPDAIPMGFTQQFQWTIPATEGVHTLNVWVTDAVGNTGHTTASVYYATRSPQCLLAITGGKYSNAVEELSVDLQVVDQYGLPVQVQLGFDMDPPPGAPWEANRSTMLVQIPYGTTEGTHTVTVRARSSIGLVGQVAIAQVVLDRTPPTLEVLRPKEGSRLTQDSTVVELRFDREDANGVRSAYYMVDGDWVPIDLDSDVVRVDMGRWGRQQLWVNVEDMAGNTNTVMVEFRLEEETGSPWTVVAIVAAGVAVAVAVLFYLRRREINR